MDVKTLCLGVLYGGNASGYEIKKQVEEGPFSHFYAAGFGSIYPALTALCEEGCLSCREMQQPKRPDKKVYDLTPKGRAVLLDALLQDPARDRVRSDFMFLVFFGELLTARRLDKVLSDRLDWLRARVSELERCLADDPPPGQAFALGLGIAVHRAQIDYVEANRHILVAEALRTEPSFDDARGPGAGAVLESQTVAGK